MIILTLNKELFFKFNYWINLMSNTYVSVKKNIELKDWGKKKNA